MKTSFRKTVASKTKTPINQKQKKTFKSSVKINRSFIGWFFCVIKYVF